MDFGALPPEINSARMYGGPGSSSLQAAASAWNGIAAELNSAATGYDNVVTQLVSDAWMGPASTSMASAAQQYASWMSTAATQAEQAATQARSAAAAYEQAFAATVPPPLIAANRAETAAATQANVFGQYTPLIAQLEAQYGEMWAQDSAAMYAYAGQSAAAAQVTPFASPAATTNPAGTAAQAGAVNSAAATSTASSTQNILSQLTSSLPTSLQGLASPTAAATTTDPLTSLFNFIFGTTALPTSLSGLVNDYAPYASFFYNTEGLPYFSIGMGNNFIQIAKTTGLLSGPAAAAAAPAATGGLGGLGGMLGGGGGGAVGSGVAANLGSAGAVGKLAVPPSWIGGAPLAAPHAPLAISSVSAAPESGGAGNLLGGMQLAGTGMGQLGGSGPRYGFKPTVMARPPFAG
ncbi:PPE family protein [Mycobacterium sp.]|uniref:PPE family protein n=1 Tax=Mycobacterium sp. TaxID=1785 RepID=UPI003C78739A